MSGMYVRSGELCFRVVSEWVKMPGHMPALPVAGVACTKDGWLYAITRNHEHPIVEFDPEGQYVKTLGVHLQFGSEHGISVSPDNCLWVCDSARHVVYKITRDGEVVRRLGTLDVSCQNGFDPDVPYPHNLYMVTRLGEPFNLPTGAVEADDGMIYCSDGYGNAAVHAFDPQGKHVLSFGGPGNAPDKFRLPHSVWLDGQDRLWVADRDNYRVKVFDRVGNVVRCFDPVYPRGTMYGPSTLWGDDRRIYVGQNSIGILVFDQKALARECILEAPFGSSILGHSLCGDRTGNLYIGHLNPSPMISRLERIK